MHYICNLKKKKKKVVIFIIMKSYCTYIILTFKKLYIQILLSLVLIFAIHLMVIRKYDIMTFVKLDPVDEFQLCLDNCGNWKNVNFTNLSSNGKAGTCSTDANKRGFNQSIITFTFYGDMKGGREYFLGIEKNIELLSKFYPGWIMQVYHNVIEKNAVRKLCEVHCMNKDVLDICYAGDIPGFGNVLNIHKFMWRFLGLANPKVGYMMSRDLDSRFTEREAAAVREWLQSGAALHVMRDHTAHRTEILGGLWGAKVEGYRDIWRPLFDKMLEELKNKNTYNDDQIALKQVFKHAGDIPGFMIQHDSYYCRVEEFIKGEMRAFPTRRLIAPRNFVGSDYPTKNITVECPLPCRKHPDWVIC